MYRKNRIYCEHCGTKLIIGKRLVGYDPITGNPLYETTTLCNKATWFSDWNTTHMKKGYVEWGDIG